MNDSLVFLSSSFLSFLLACRRALKLKHRNIRGRESDSFGDDDISLCEEAVAYAVWVSLKLLSIHVVGMLLPLNSSCSNLSFLMSRISAALTKNPLSYQLGVEALLTSFTLSSSSSSSFSSFSASVGGCLFFGSVTHTGSSSMDSCRFFGSVKDTGSSSALTTPNLYELLCGIFSSGCLVTSDIISVSMHQTSLQSSSEFPSVSLPTCSSSAQPSSGEGKVTKEKELPLEHQIELQFLLCELGIGL
ncbi:hypothetical protein YC2023_113874 [Brassica napus]|uniref:(rape) hypothetical protein n=1 Tax=Brassica napus TaxID=3708 RepID=A0A816IZX7_BRANA|nr:unnamed protein product [Brassica napus]